MATYQALKSQALAHLKAQNPAQAFRAFRPALEQPTRIEGYARKDAMAVFSQIASAISGPSLADKLSQLSEDPDDTLILYRAAYELYEHQLFGVAADFLRHANDLQPGQRKIVTELVSNLEALTLNAEAVDVLQRSGLVPKDPFCAYLLGFNALMTGDLEIPRAMLPHLEGTEDNNLIYMTQALQSMLLRADALGSICALDENDLTGWHMVINAGLLLHESTTGFDEGMRGRYAYVLDNYGLLKEGVQRVQALLQTPSLSVQKVIAAPSRSSRILGIATAEALGLPLCAWTEDSENALLIAYDMDKLGNVEVAQALRENRPGQVLWAHASCWTDPYPYTPDLTTYFYQSTETPWSGGANVFDPKTGGMGLSEPDTREDEAIAQDILTAEISQPSRTELSLLQKMLGALSALPPEGGAGVYQKTDYRNRQRTGTPVRSNAFR